MLTDLQRSLIVGTMLGDGTMRCKRHALLEINHSVKQQAYVDWKFEALRSLVATPPQVRRGNGARLAYRFTTRSVPELTEIYRTFYKGGKKVVPEIDLDATALAVWFMDDGSRSRSSVYFNTQQFDVEDQQRLMQILKRQLDIESALNKDKTYHRIRLAVSSMPRFRALVEPTMLPCFAYKLPSLA